MYRREWMIVLVLAGLLAIAIALAPPVHRTQSERTLLPWELAP